MAAKIIGYSLGAIFVALFFAPVPIAAWLIYDRVSVLSSTSITEATIVDCYSHRSGSANSKLSFGPVAKSIDGLEVKGNFRFSRRGWCMNQIGKQVKLRVSQSDSSHNRIYSFFQFWLLPLIFTLIAFVIYPMAYFAKWTRQRQAAAKDQSV